MQNEDDENIDLWTPVLALFASVIIGLFVYLGALMVRVYGSSQQAEQIVNELQNMR